MLHENIAPVARALATFNRDQIGSAIEVLIALLDVAEPDADLEDNNDQEASDGDDRGDVAWVEWDKMRGAQKNGHNLLAGEEDDEDDDPDTGVEDNPRGFDPEEDMCLAGDDRIGSGSLTRASLICEDNGPGDADDAEREQMVDDVPMLPVVSLDHNLFNDQRQDLGISNLQSTFQTNGRGVMSADSGKVFVSKDDPWRSKIGEPV